MKFSFFKKRKIFYFFLLLIIIASGFVYYKLKPPSELHAIFKSEDAKQRFYKAYDTGMAAWNTAYTSKDIYTSYGKTHINICGPDDKPALILLSIMTFSSVSWYPNIPELSKHFKIYSVDIIGDHNKSEATKLITDKTGFAKWLREVIDSLKIDKTNIAGESYGGFITLSLPSFILKELIKLY